MNFNEVKCKFCGASIKVLPGAKDATCSACYNSFRLDDEQANLGMNNASSGQLNSNIPNPFESLNFSPNINNNVPNTQNNNIVNNNLNAEPVMQMQNPQPIPQNQEIPQVQQLPQSQIINNQPIQQQNQYSKMEQVPSIPQVPNVPLMSNFESGPINPQPVNMQPQTNNTNNNNNGSVMQEPKKPIKKKKKKNITKILLYIFFIGVIIASGIVFYIDYTKEPEEPEIFEQLPSEIVVEEKEKTKAVVDDFPLNLAPDLDFNNERLYYKNNEIIGRLEIPDLFNVLVAKTSNNSFYLSHDIFRNYDIRGTEFLDYRNNPTDKQINIYGHNTRDLRIKVAFLKLEKFLDKEFFDANPYIIFQHDTGKSAYKIIAIKEVRSTNNEHMYIDRVGTDFVEHVRNMTTGEGVINSRDISYDENSSIIVLQTCSHHWDDAFYTVIGVKVRDL